MVILNTCHIREKAAEKVYSELGRLEEAEGRKARTAAMTIAVAGCVAQAEGAEIWRASRAVDLVVGPQSYHRLPEMIARHRARQAAMRSKPIFPARRNSIRCRSRRRLPASRAFLTVQEGCDKFCTFCVVPYTRGAEYSRPPQPFLPKRERLRRKARARSRCSARTSTPIAAWAGRQVLEPGASAASPCRRHRGVERLRYTTSHPRDMDDDLIAAHGEIDKLMPYLHLPVQSGSDRVLEAMNRQHTRDDYLRLVERIRAARPDIALSSDFIVGFPGESDDGFRGHAAAGARRRLRHGFLLQIQRASRHARCRHAQSRFPKM